LRSLPSLRLPGVAIIIIIIIIIIDMITVPP
jgi:hypothetical protein